MGAKDKQLAIAIKEQRTEDAVDLLSKITNVDFQTKERHTALHIAVKNNNIVVAAILLQRNASMNILPKNKAYQTIDHSPIITAFRMGESAFRMGESHEEMQLLFLRYLKVVRDKWQSDKDKKIIQWIPINAMQFGTTRVFFEAISQSGVDNTRDASGLTPLMHIMGRLTLFCTQPVAFDKKMQSVFEIVNKYPDMAWERVGCKYHCKKGSTEKKQMTALGMVVFQHLRERKYHDIIVAELVEEYEKHGDVIPTQVKMFTGKNVRMAGRENNLTIMQSLETKLIPGLFTIMLRPMRIALAMATHIRLGTQIPCWAAVLHTDTIDMIFNVLIHDIVHNPDTLMTILL